MNHRRLRGKALFIGIVTTLALGSAMALATYPVTRETQPVPLAPADSVTTASSIYLGVSLHPAPWDMNALDQFEVESGRKHAIVHYFIAFEKGNPPEQHRLAAVHARGAVPMITWEWKQTNLAGILAG